MHSPFDLLAVLLVISACIAYLNDLVLKLPLTVGLLVGAAVGALLLIALDAVLPGLGLKLTIRGVVGSINFPATLLDGFLAFLLFAGALQVNSADMVSRKWTILTLATVATILSAGLIAATLFAASRLLGLDVSLPWCLVFGALISPTDPVLVLDVLAVKQRGAERLAGALAPKTQWGLRFRNHVIRAFAIPGVARLTVGRDIVDALVLPDYRWPLLHEVMRIQS